MSVGDLDQTGVSHAQKRQPTNGGAPHVIKALAMRGEGRQRQVALGDSRLFMPEEGIEHLRAGLRT
jgi:hypothetical protein